MGGLSGQSGRTSFSVVFVCACVKCALFSGSVCVCLCLECVLLVYASQMEYSMCASYASVHRQ